MKKSLLFAGFLLALPFCSPKPASADNVLDIGTDYRIRGISIEKADYGNSSGQNYAYYSQRALAHVGARFSPNIEIMTQFQAIGVAGSTGTVNPVVDTTGGRYPNNNFTPWVQWAYLKAKQVYDLPVDLTIGRQPITLGDGFLLSDDDLGFTGIRAESRLPWYGLRSDLFTFKTFDSQLGSSDKDIYGAFLTKPMPNTRIQAGWLMERDNSGQTLFIRPSENVSPGNQQFQTLYPGQVPMNVFNFNATQITKNYYDARIEGRLLQGGFYKAEAAIQSGSVSRDPSIATSTAAAALGYSPSIKLSGYGFLVSAGLFTHFSKYGPIEIHGTFGIASGDTNGGSDSAFQPDYGHQYDGLERSGFGELYGATLYNAQPFGQFATPMSSSTVSGLPPGYSGIRVIGAGVTAHPTALLSVGIDYYVYTAQQTPNSTFQITSSDSSLGTELDVGAGFAYTSYLTFRASFALFQPGAAYVVQSNATRMLIEAIGRF